MTRVLVVGTGLIGTSIALALRGGGVDVRLDDIDTGRVGEAAERGAGTPYAADDPPAGHAVLAVPPTAVAPVLRRVQEQRLAETASDVASVKVAPLAAAAALGCDLAAFVGGHPIAGREQSGPGAASGDLFVGRTWVLTPTVETSAAARAAADDVVRRCGGVPLVLDPAFHDTVVALTSHAPQLIASALAALLVGADPDTLRLVGSGLRDTTRLAGSDPALWTEIALANATPLADVLDRLAASLADVTAALRAGNDVAVRELLDRGNTGRAPLTGGRVEPGVA